MCHSGERRNPVIIILDPDFRRDDNRDFGMTIGIRECDWN